MATFVIGIEAVRYLCSMKIEIAKKMFQAAADSLSDERVKRAADIARYLP